MPLRCANGIFFCSRLELLDPSASSRRSVALCLFLPLGPDNGEDGSPDWRRCDSLSRRCRARSFFRFAASELSSSAGFAFNFAVDRGFGSEEGGLDDCRDVSASGQKDRATVDSP